MFSSRTPKAWGEGKKHFLVVVWVREKRNIMEMKGKKNEQHRCCPVAHTKQNIKQKTPSPFPFPFPSPSTYMHQRLCVGQEIRVVAHFQQIIDAVPHKGFASCQSHVVLLFLIQLLVHNFFPFAQPFNQFAGQRVSPGPHGAHHGQRRGSCLDQ